MNKLEVTRRRFRAQVALAVPAGAVVLDAVITNTASAQAAPGQSVPGQSVPGQASADPTKAAKDKLPKLDPADPSAKALLYVDDATKVDRKNPLAARYAPGQTCSTCAQIQGKEGEDYRPCGIFPGKRVSSKGWCSVWAKKD